MPSVVSKTSPRRAQESTRWLKMIPGASQNDPRHTDRPTLPGFLARRWGLRKCLQGRSEATRALDSASGNAFSVASEPQMQSKVLLGLAPELPHALKCCSGLHSKRLLGQAPKLPGRSKSLPEAAPPPHCFQTVVRIILNPARV